VKKALVIIKKTPDTESRIKLTGDQKAVDNAEIKFIINPYDEFAIEEALQIKTREPSCEVVIASVGGDDVKELIIKGLAMGGDRGLLISNNGLAKEDSLMTAKVLAAVIKAEQPDIVLCGKQAIDDDNMHVGTMVAELLNWPHVNVVNELKINGSEASAKREIEGGQTEVYAFTLPAVIGANKSLNTPRYASLPGIMKAKKKPFDTKSVADYGLDAAKLQSGVKTVVKGYKFPPQKPEGKMFKGEDVETMVAKVVKLLREEAKVI
jgi:electron transfer flavoprotein beta subunit